MTQDAGEIVPLADLMAEYRPGSQGDDWTWEDEAHWLWEHDFDAMSALVASIAVDGQREPVTCGDDGRLWDGHHRIVAMHHLGCGIAWRRLWSDLSDDEQADALVASVGDWEDRTYRASHLGRSGGSDV